MKNYIIGLLVICLAVLGSFLYKTSISPVLERFPIEQVMVKKTGGEPPLYLFIFFSRNNCQVCLESIQVLNQLPPVFVVTGIVPVEELKNEVEFRKTTGASFKLIAFNKTFKKFSPHYAPTIFGVSGSGRVLFVLPGVPEQKDYLNNFLVNFYGKSMELLIQYSD